MRRGPRFAVILSVAAGALVVAPRAAQAQEGDDGVAMEANRGFHLGLGPTLLLPLRDDGPYGGGLTLDGRYGIKAGPTVLAPGGRLAGYLISSRFVGTAMPTFRVTLPVGPLAPFIVGGIGAGWISNDSESGLALLGGGGLMIHVGHFFAFGAEATYETIQGTEFKTLAIGPAISFGG
jgi:hypothetical protein